MIQDKGVQKNREFKNALSELKKTQRRLIQLEKIHAMHYFAADIAHEIKSPLSTILSGVEFLILKHSRSRSNKEIKEALIKIKEATLRADNTIKSLLEYSRLAEPKLEPSNINSIISKVLSITEHQMSLSNIKIKKDLSRNLPIVNVNENQVQQVLMNLLLNSYAAMPRGGEIKIWTHIEEVADIGPASGHRFTDYFKIGERVVKIRIEDTGCGIARRQLDRIFDRFFTTKNDIRHIGLGLNISRAIIDKHKGTIEINSEINKGTKVTITLPFHQ